MSSTALAVQLVDPRDDDAVARWHAVAARCVEHDSVEPTDWSLPELLEVVRDPYRKSRQELYIGYAGATPVAAGGAECDLRENLALAEVRLHVLPDWRRRGHGTALWRAMGRQLHADGRTSAIAYVEVGPDAEAAPGTGFATRMGFTARITEVHRRLRLPIAADHLDRLIAEADAGSAGYEFRAWEGRCPDEYVAGLAFVRSRLSSDAPRGGLEFNNDRPDVERLRAGERLAQAQRRRTFTAVALGPDGSVVANSDLFIPAEEYDPRNAYQGSTLVLPEHRGHRLGLGVKARNHRLAQEAMPGLCRSIHTWNAAENPWMIAINARLGYEPIDREIAFQGAITTE